MKKLKRYCKYTLNMFINKKNFDDKKFFNRIDFFCQIVILNKYVKIVKKSRIF